MVEIDVLDQGGELVIAHDSDELKLPNLVALDTALAALSANLPAEVALNVDVKNVGCESKVLHALARHGLADRTLISTMKYESLRTMRALSKEAKLGWSVPKARMDYLGKPLVRPLGLAGLFLHRAVLPYRCARAVRSGVADAIMAHWRVVTPRLVTTVADAGGELFAWTVDDRLRLGELQNLGVTGVITNDLTLFEDPPRQGVAPGV
jgi:glycerophosphoryl diester phosphodiesterase